MKLWIAAVVLVLGFSGCATNTVYVDSKVFTPVPDCSTFVTTVVPSGKQDSVDVALLSKLLRNSLVMPRWRPAAGEKPDMQVLASLVTQGPLFGTRQINDVITGQTSSGGVTSFNANTSYSSRFGSSNTSGTVCTPPTYGVVGVVPRTVQTVEYLHTLCVVGVRPGIKGGVFTVTAEMISSTGDPRTVAPALFSGLKPWIARDSGRRINVPVFQ